MAKNVKNTTFFNPLDLIAPHSCRGCGKLGDVLCDCCKKHILDSNFYNNCPKCKRPLADGAHKCRYCRGLPPIYTIGVREGLLGDLIHVYKYYSVRAIGEKLAELIYERLLDDLPDETVIVPLPTSTKHIRERGFDHTLFVAKKLARFDKRLKVGRILMREKNTVQVGTDKKTRILQAEEAYSLKEGVVLDKNTTYLLLDDVWTTGASMITAVKKLRAGGAKRIVIALLSVSLLDD